MSDKKSIDDTAYDDPRFVDFVITKASIGKDGIKRWAATVSKFAEDKQGDEVTPGFYNYNIQKFRDGEYPWPALVVSHFDAPSAETIREPVPDVFRAGTTTEMYIDGGKPKAKGYFEDTPLGNAVYGAVRNDLDANLPHEERARISMAWWPEKGGVEKSDGKSKHNRGIIRHFATTRVPIVGETEIMTKSDTDKRRSKLEDAKTIIGPELAEMLQEAVQRMKSKSEDIELIEKKEDGKTDYPKGEAYKRHMKDGEFDMGDCLTAKKSEGIERKQALAICLSMARKAGADVPPPPKKAELEDDLAEKAQGGSDGEFEMDKCLGRFKKIGFSEEAAKETCDRLAKKWSRQSTTKEVIGRKADLEDDEEDEEMEESNDGCIKAQMDEGKSREEAEKHCAESEAEAEEKADLDAVVDELIAEVLSDDSEVQVVKGDAKEATEADVNDVNVAGISENELALTEALLDVLKENELLKSAVLKSDEEDETPVSDLEVEDVNEPEPTEKGSVSHPLDKYFLTMKSALVDDSLDRSEKAIIINHSFEKMGEIAKEEIEKRTPASPRDQAELLKAALEEVVAPMAGQLDLLVQQVNDLQAEKKAYEKALLAPKSKQLRMTANNQQVAKSETEEPKGALTARQIADLTVSRLNPIRY